MWRNKLLAYRQGPTKHLEREAQDILSFVQNELGLTPASTDFVFVPQQRIHTLTGYLFPVALPHWSRGRDIILTRNSPYTIYEIVFNSDPALAYVAHTATPGEVKMIFAHVYGHTHIFATNVYESKDTNLLARIRHAVDRYYEYEAMYGADRLDALIDFVHGLKYLFSVEDARNTLLHPQSDEQVTPKIKPAHMRFVARDMPDTQPDHDDINDDILGYVLKNAHALEDWEKDIILTEASFLRHIYGKAHLKYVHEGFATWVHRKAMVHFFSGDDFFQSAFLDNSIMPSISNPYWFGWAILDALEREGLNIPELVKRISDEELFYAYFTRDVWHSILRRTFGQDGWDEMQRALGSYNEMRQALVSRSFALRPRIRVSQYEKLGPDWDRNWHVFMAEPDDWSGPKGTTLILVSDTPLDETYAKETVRLVARVWRGLVRIYWPKATTTQNAGR